MSPRCTTCTTSAASVVSTGDWGAGTCRSLGRRSCQPGTISSGLVHDRPSGWGSPRLISYSSRHRKPSPRCASARLHGLSPRSTSITGAASCGLLGGAVSSDEVAPAVVLAGAIVISMT